MFDEGIRCGWVGLLMGPKLRSEGERLLQKSAHESGKVAEIEICARIIPQVNGQEGPRSVY